MSRVAHALLSVANSRIDSAPIDDGEDRHESNDHDPRFVVGGLQVEDSTKSKGKISSDVKSGQEEESQADQKGQLEVSSTSTQHKGQVDRHDPDDFVHVRGDIDINSSEELFEAGVFGVLDQPVKKLLEEVGFGSLTKKVGSDGDSMGGSRSGQQRVSNNSRRGTKRFEPYGAAIAGALTAFLLGHFPRPSGGIFALWHCM